MGGRSVWRGSRDVWIARWRGFVILRIRLGVRISIVFIPLPFSDSPSVFDLKFVLVR
jgi:hypothetical protein